MIRVRKGKRPEYDEGDTVICIDPLKSANGTAIEGKVYIIRRLFRAGNMFFAELNDLNGNELRGDKLASRFIKYNLPTLDEELFTL